MPFAGPSVLTTATARCSLGTKRMQPGSACGAVSAQKDPSPRPFFAPTVCQSTSLFEREEGVPMTWTLLSAGDRTAAEVKGHPNGHGKRLAAAGVSNLQRAKGSWQPRKTAGTLPYNKELVPIGGWVAALVTCLKAPAAPDGENVLAWKRPSTLSADYVQIMEKAGCLDAMRSVMLVGNPACGAMYHSDQLYVGLMYLGPGADYPRHGHDAEEMIQVIGGSADWWVAGERRGDRPTAGKLATSYPGEPGYAGVRGRHCAVLTRCCCTRPITLMDAST